MKTTILTVFHDAAAAAGAAHALSDDHAVARATTGREAIERVLADDIALIVSDDTLPDMSGEELATAVRDVYPNARVIIVSERENIENALGVLEPGRFVYLEKPVTAARLRHAVAVEADRARVFAENWSLRARLEGMDPSGVLIGSSMAIEHVRERIRYVGAASANVLVTGENGTGKHLAAEGIHRASERAGGPFLQVDCATAPEENLERELFGFSHPDVRGAESRQRGKLELAAGGTLLVVEIGDLTHDLQERLVAALPHYENTRVIATTRHDLRARVQKGEFREDLYYAINALSVEMPTLRERRDDIPALAGHFVRYAAARNNVAPVDFTAAALERLTRAPWRGNVRELQNVIERTVLLSGGATVDDGDLRMTPGTGAGPDFTEVERVFRTGSVRDMERLMILNRLAENDDNRTRSAESLEISVRTLRNKLNEYGVKRSTADTEDEVFSI